MDGFMTIVVLCLFILVCALIHELGKAKADICDLEYEITQQKLEYRREIKTLKNQLNFIKFYREAGNAQIDKTLGEFSEQNGSES